MHDVTHQVSLFRCVDCRMSFFSLTLCNRRDPPEITYNFNIDKKILCIYLEHYFRNVLCLMQNKLYDG
jgi:hypothetical protein